MIWSAIRRLRCLRMRTPSLSRRGGGWGVVCMAMQHCIFLNISVYHLVYNLLTHQTYISNINSTPNTPNTNLTHPTSPFPITTPRLTRPSAPLSKITSPHSPRRTPHTIPNHALWRNTVTVTSACPLPSHKLLLVIHVPEFMHGE